MAFPPPLHIKHSTYMLEAPVKTQHQPTRQLQFLWDSQGICRITATLRNAIQKLVIEWKLKVTQK